MRAIAIRETFETFEASDDRRKRVLFLLDTWSSFDQQYSMARCLEDAGWECWFMPLAGARLRQDAAERVRVWQLTAVSLREGSNHPEERSEAIRTGSVGRLRSLAGRLPRMAVGADLMLAARMTKEWHLCRVQARSRIGALGPQCVVTAQDRLQTALPVVAAAKDLGIPIILAASAGLFMPDGCAFLRKDSPRLRLDPGPGTDWGQRMLNRLVGWLAPDQVFASRWGRMLYQTAGWQLAAWLTGLTLPSFWYHGARFADCVVISGDDERLVCERAGIPASRLAAIGSAALQVQFECRRDCERIRAELGISRSEVLVIVSIPPLWEHGMMDEATHFAFVDTLFAFLAKARAAVILSLHPKMKRAHYVAHATASGLRLADRPLIEILSAADLFVAAGYSTTLRWAMAVKIPSINLDFWDLDETTYRDIAEYRSVRCWDALETWLAERIAEGRPKPDAAPLPMGLICDGRFGERFVELVERMSGAGRCAVNS
jgi:hypothetical protein